MKEKFYRFMQGRYGADQFSRFLLGCMVVLWLLSLFIKNNMISQVLYFVSLGLIVYSWYRMFSKNISARYKENQKYLGYKEVVRSMLSKDKRKSSSHKIFLCPKCKQKIRIPKGKGRIVITCPSCKNEFKKRT